MGIISYIKDRLAGSGILKSESDVKVGFDDRRIWVRAPGQAEKSLSWDDLGGVAIATNDQGPFGPDVFWVLKGPDDTVLAYPMGSSGEEELMKKLQSLPGFDNKALIAAMSCADNNAFLCWEKKT